LDTRPLSKRTAQSVSLWADDLGRETIPYGGQRWREASSREGRVAIPRSQLLGGIPEGGDEPGVAFVELPAHGVADRVEHGCGGFLQMPGTMVRMLAQDRRHPQRLGAGLGSPVGGFGFDLVDQVENPCSPGIRRKLLPAGEGREGHRLAGRILEAVELLSSLPGGILQGPAEPVPKEVSGDSKKAPKRSCQGGARDFSAGPGPEPAGREARAEGRVVRTAVPASAKKVPGDSAKKVPKRFQVIP
jgi:hypothetical protein